jgi:hypothetical protein
MTQPSAPAITMPAMTFPAAGVPGSGVWKGLGPDLLHTAASEVTAAYHDGLMAFRATPPPPVRPALLGTDGPLLGAADEAFARLLTDERLQAWVS